MNTSVYSTSYTTKTGKNGLKTSNQFKIIKSMINQKLLTGPILKNMTLEETELVQ